MLVSLSTGNLRHKEYASIRFVEDFFKINEENDLVKEEWALEVPPVIDAQEERINTVTEETVFCLKTTALGVDKATPVTGKSSMKLPSLS